MSGLGVRRTGGGAKLRLLLAMLRRTPPHPAPSTQQLALPPLSPAGPEETQKVIACLHLLLELAGSPDQETALAAGHCLLKACHLHPGDAAAVLADPRSIALLASLLDPVGAPAKGASLGRHAAGGTAGLPQPPGQQAAGFNADHSPLLLLVLAQVVEARPQLLQQYGASLRPAVAACLAAVRDPGLQRRWSKLLAA